MKLMVMTNLVMAVAVSLVACGLETAEPETESSAEATQELSIAPGATFKKQSDLENDGWTCKLLEGTSLTFCTKPGELGSWSCDANGNCTSNMKRPRFPPFRSAPSVSVGVKDSP